MSAMPNFRLHAAQKTFLAALLLGAAMTTTPQAQDASEIDELVATAKEELAVLESLLKEAEDALDEDDDTERAARSRLADLNAAVAEMAAATAQAQAETRNLIDAIADSVNKAAENWTPLSGYEARKAECIALFEDCDKDAEKPDAELDTAENKTSDDGEAPEGGPGFDTPEAVDPDSDTIDITVEGAPEPGPKARAETEAPGGAHDEPQTDPAPGTGSDSGPLLSNGRPRRVLTLPEAALHRRPGGRQERILDTFSVLYVFDERERDGENWLLVGSALDEPQGFIRATQSEDWQTMLVMKYAPKNDRGRVVFFRNPSDVMDIIEDDFTGQELMDDLYASIEDGTWDADKVVSIEPETAVVDSERPYLMPILDFERTFSPIDGREIQILELAAINSRSTEQVEARPAADGSRRDINAAIVTSTADVSDFKVGVAFVIDTTQSMGPYIDEVRDYVIGMRRDLDAIGLRDNFDFSLVGYRDSLRANADVEYVTEIFRDFGDPGDFNALSSDVARMVPAQVSTTNWREDAFAGLDDAINRLSWGSVNGRVVFLITDASPRSINDSLARDPSLGPASISALINSRNVSLFIVHMKTDRAARVSMQTDGVDDTARGVDVYSQIKVGARDNVVRYFGLTNDSTGSFSAALLRLRSQLIPILSDLNRARPIDLDDVPGQNAFDDFDVDADMFGGAVAATDISDPEQASLISDAVISELFRQQQEYLGSRSGTEAPPFYRAWAADRDLVDPSRRALEVSVFMTREQLSELAQRIDRIVEALENKETGLGAFFTEVQERSGRSSVDPSLAEFLPEYLRDLPYSTRFQSITEADWSRLPRLSQLEMIDDVKDKAEAYRRINATEDGWFQLESRSGGEQIFPLPIEQLP